LRSELITNQQGAWKIIFDFSKITDKDIDLILTTDYDVDLPKSTNEAMKAIVKMYTYETGLYRALNNASCYHDKSKIKTLGPYALLLYRIIVRRGSFKEKNDKLINKEN